MFCFFLFQQIQQLIALNVYLYFIVHVYFWASFLKVEAFCYECDSVIIHNQNRRFELPMKVALTSGPFSFLRQDSLTVHSCIRSTSPVLNPCCTLACPGFFKLHHRVELKERWSLATRWYGERINSLVSCPHRVLICDPPSTSVKWSLFYSFPTPDNVRRYELKLEHLPLNFS